MGSEISQLSHRTGMHEPQPQPRSIHLMNNSQVFLQFLHCWFIVQNLRRGSHWLVSDQVTIPGGAVTGWVQITWLSPWSWSPREENHASGSLCFHHPPTETTHSGRKKIMHNILFWFREVGGMFAAELTSVHYRWCSTELFEEDMVGAQSTQHFTAVFSWLWHSTCHIVSI